MKKIKAEHRASRGSVGIAGIDLANQSIGTGLRQSVRGWFVLSSVTSAKSLPACHTSLSLRSRLDLLRVLLSLHALPAHTHTAGAALLLESVADAALALFLGLGAVQLLFEDGLRLARLELAGEVLQTADSVVGGGVGAAARVGEVVGVVLDLVAGTAPGMM